MRRPELWLAPDSPLCTTLLLLLPLIELRPETDGARRVETRVCHQQETDVIRFSFSCSGQSERDIPGCQDRYTKEDGFRVDVCQESEPRKRFCEKPIDYEYRKCFKSVLRDNMGDFVAQDSSQLVVVANHVVEEAGGDQDKT